MGKMKIRLFPDGTIHMETEGIKGEKCTDYAGVLARLADAKIDSIKRTHEFYENEIIGLDRVQHLRDNSIG